MKIYHYIIFLFCCSSIFSWAQQEPMLSGNSCSEPSERLLQHFLRQIKSENKVQRLKIRGLTKGAFTQKDQIDYVFWLNEQKTKGKEKKRQIIKLVCKASRWKMASIGWLPQGVVISKDNFIDVTGDDVLEFLYPYSYSNSDCVDGCAVLSLQGLAFRDLYHKKEERSCQAIDFTNYNIGTELPFVTYQLDQKKTKGAKQALLIEQRLVKKYNGGTYNDEALELAKVDTTITILEYDATSQRFLEPIVAPCNAEAFMDGVINHRHPALRLVTQRLNKKKANQFYIEGIFRASLTQKGQMDFLFYSNSFTNTKDNLVKRKVVKVICDGQDWKIVGIMYVNSNFSATNIQDVDGDGIAEIIDESKIVGDSTCIKTYRILSFKGVMGKLVYAHKNTYTYCDVYDMSTNSMTDGVPLGLEYKIAFEDVDNDGKTEIVRSCSEAVINFKYDEQQQRFMPMH